MRIQRGSKLQRLAGEAETVVEPSGSPAHALASPTASTKRDGCAPVPFQFGLRFGSI
jgi:hypothetical protein